MLDITAGYWWHKIELSERFCHEVVKLILWTALLLCLCDIFSIAVITLQGSWTNYMTSKVGICIYHWSVEVFFFLFLSFFDIVGLVLLTMWALILYIFLYNLVKTPVLLSKFALETHTWRFGFEIEWPLFPVFYCMSTGDLTQVFLRLSMSCPWLVYLWAENARVLCGKHYIRCVVCSLNVPRRETTSASSDTVGLL